MIGSTLAVQDGEEQCRNENAKIIATEAARLVAAGDMGRPEAINTVANHFRSSSEAMGDETGVCALQNPLPTPSREAPRAQVAAIAAELLPDAQQAAETL